MHAYGAHAYRYMCMHMGRMCIDTCACAWGTCAWHRLPAHCFTSLIADLLLLTFHLRVDALRLLMARACT